MFVPMSRGTIDHPSVAPSYRELISITPFKRAEVSWRC